MHTYARTHRHMQAHTMHTLAHTHTGMHAHIHTHKSVYAYEYIHLRIVISDILLSGTRTLGLKQDVCSEHYFEL